MNTMTRTGWEKLVAARQTQRGGDLWNTDNIWRKAFASRPDVLVARYQSLTTGLWCDVVLTLADGSQIARRIFG